MASIRPGVRIMSCMSKLALQPWVTGALLVALHYAPAEMKARFLQSPDAFERVRCMLRLLFGVTVIRAVNGALTAWACRNWRSSRGADWQWRSEVAVVTGGCSGIGKAVVERLTAHGVRVAVVDIVAAPRDLAVNGLVRHYACDITSPEAVAQVAAAIRQDLGHPSILVNNAGIAGAHTILETPNDWLRKVAGVNLLSHWYTTKEFLPAMIRQNRGHVVTVASLASFVTLTTAVDYSATKSGALAFHEGLTAELRNHYRAPGVLTTVVHPNFVRTALFDDKIASVIEASLGKLLTVDDVADPIVDQILSRRGGQLVVPATLTFLAGIRGWSTWLQELARDGLAKPTTSQQVIKSS